MAAISRRALLTAARERARLVTNATGWVGQIGAHYGLQPGVEAPADPPTKGNGDQRVKPYFVLYPGAGTPGDETDAADTLVDLDWPLRITAAAGDIDDLLALVDRIHALFWRWTPDLPNGIQAGPLRVPAGYDPGVITDRNVDPHRLYVPLLYQLTAHT